MDFPVRTWSPLALMALALAGSLAPIRVAGVQDQQYVAGTGRLNQIVADAFRRSHDGWSADEVILQDELNRRFVETCRQELPDSSAADLNRALLNLRKAGKLEHRATRKDERDTAGQLASGEMAARLIMDRFQISTDRIMCDPEMKKAFDDAVREIDPEADVYLGRKAVWQLRKMRALKPELILRIADWDRRIETISLEDLAANPDAIPAVPGIYIFRDRTGYLYVGEAVDLKARLSSHAAGSDRDGLAHYLARQAEGEITIEVHSFPADSRMSEIRVRRAYESELIRSRNPRFNIRP